MIDLALLIIFIPTFFFVSITPGMCMTLAMTMGMTIGVKRALWMMIGELVAVGLLAILTVIGLAAIIVSYPQVFTAFKYLGGAYLFYIGVQMWLSRGKMAIGENFESQQAASRTELIVQGFTTAAANPKGWAFFITLLPPFINTELPLTPQLTILISLILIMEFSCLLIYASGGRTLRRFLEKRGNVRLLNRVAGTLMMGVGVWLAIG